jgi:hypothetical protein
MTTFTPAQSHPVKYTFNNSPKRDFSQSLSHVSAPSLFPPGVYLSTHRRDVVRQISLGAQPPEPIRMCTRCSSVSFLPAQRTISKSPAMRAWELRFERSCICGGQWILDTMSSCVR